VSPEEVLKTASKLIKIYKNEYDDVQPITIERRPTFEELPVDHVLADGGWRTLYHEKNIIRESFYEEDIRTFLWRIK